MPQNKHQTTYSRIPKPELNQKIFKLNIKELRPTQICVGFAEVLSRIKDFKEQNKNEIMSYLQEKPVPVIKNLNNKLWILDRHHRLSALMSIDEELEAYCYIISTINTSDYLESLKFLRADLNKI